FSLLSHRSLCLSSLFLSTHPATTALYTLSLHDALPISTVPRHRNGEAHPGWRRGSQPWMAKNTTRCLSRDVIDLYRRPQLLSGLGGQHPEQPVALVVDPGGEEERVARAVVGDSPAERDRPKAVDGDRTVVGAAQLAEELAGRGVHGVDAAVAEVADQEVAAEAAEVRRRAGDTARR